MTTNLKKILLLSGDIAVLYLSLYLTLIIRYQQHPNPGLWLNHFWPFSFIFILWILIFYIANLYNLNLAVNNSDFFRLTTKSFSIAALLSLAFFYLNPQINIAPKRNMLIFVLVFGFLFFLWRRFYNWSLKAYLPKNKIAIIGLNKQSKELIKKLKEKAHLGFTTSFVIDSENTFTEYKGIPIFKKLEDLKSLLKNKNINTLIIGANPHSSEKLRHVLFQCLPLKINYQNLSDFYEAITGKVPLDVINRMWFLENLSQGENKFFKIFKRSFDILLSLFVFIFSLPFWLLIIIIIKIESKGPVFFIQKRTGQNNKQFKLIKFRSMRTENNDGSLTKKKDKRITKFGSFLRVSRIDEIPQVINILKGEMSFVGPRPERPKLIEKLEQKIPFYNERMLVKPGATGWDQISGEYHSPTYTDTIKKLQYDLFYIKNQSIYLDLSIILKTIATILKKSGR